MGQTNKQRVSRDTVTNPTPNPNPGSPHNGHATWRDIIKKIKKEGLIKGKRNQHDNKSTRKWTGKLPDEVNASCEQQPSQRKRPKRHTSDKRPTKETKQREEGKKTYKVEHKTKSPAQKEAKASELHPWRLELEIFPSRLPCRHPYNQSCSAWWSIKEKK